MRLMIRDPFRELDSMQQIANQLWNTGTTARQVQRLEHPRLDVLENEDGFVIIANLPGMQKDQIHLSLLGQTLTIEGQRLAENDEKHHYLRRERGHGKFKRTVEFQTQVQANAVKAKYQDGVLSVSVPKAENAKPKQITVNVEE